MQITVTTIQQKIVEIRGVKVMPDRDLAEMYEVPTFRLNEAVKRNILRFPKDFMFQITKVEFGSLISQNAISKNIGRGGIRKMPQVFTEQGVAMLSSVLNSEKAIEVNIAIIRTFVLIRQYALNFDELSKKIKQLEKKCNKNFKEVFVALDYLIAKKQAEEDIRNRRRIGFKPG
jgi:ORF6N domain